MCLLMVFYKLFKGAPIVALHNRYAKEWTVEYPPRVTKARYRVYRPIDVASGGTWVGFNEKGLFVAVTDQHSDGAKAVRRSRGKLVSNVLIGFSSAREAAEYLRGEVGKGYQKGNFVVLDEESGFHLIYDRDVTMRELKAGVHVVTNITAIHGIKLSPQAKNLLERAEARKKRALELARDINTQDLGEGLRTLQRIAADHGGGKGRRSICYHDETGEWRMTSSTTVAVGEDVQDSRISYCPGNPCEKKFSDYSHLLKVKEMEGGEVGKKSEKLAGRKIALCLTGSVAAIEAPKLARELRRHGAEVVCYMTQYAVDYGVNPEVMVWATGRKVIRELGGRVEHLHDYDLVMIYPATLNTIGKIAQGIADNAVTTLCAATDKDKMVIAPAMNMKLYDSPILQENLEKLKKLGAGIITPRFEEGIAKIPRRDVAIDHAMQKLLKGRLEGRKALILTGPTRYDIDPVRYISNKASGRLGYWLAREGFRRGCEVRVIYGPGSVEFPDYIPVIKAYTTEDMLQETLKKLSQETYDIAIFSAAILDFKPKQRTDSKVESGKEWTIKLVPTPKVIEKVIGKHSDLFVVAFKLEYKIPEKELIEGAYQRLKELGAGLMVANDLAAIRGERHRAHIINKKKEVKTVDATKSVLAEEIFNAIEKNL